MVFAPSSLILTNYYLPLSGALGAMKKIFTLASIITIITIVALLYVKVFALDSRLSGSWELVVYDPNKTPIAELEIEFTASDAESCSVGGEWRLVKVISSSPQKNQFYPDAEMIRLYQELSYQVSDDTLTIGLNNICDYSKHLTGRLISGQAVGTYVSFGWGRVQQLGSFSIQRVGT